jgi:putative membrane protein
MEELCIRYVHFLGIILLSSTLFYELASLSRSITNAQLKKLVWVDALFGASAVIVLVSGGCLWSYFGKPSEFYTKNPIFHMKLAIFILIAIISIFPTWFFLKHRKSHEVTISIPRHVVNIVRVEAALFITIPLLAVLMAHGVGLA